MLAFDEVLRESCSLPVYNFPSAETQKENLNLPLCRRGGILCKQQILQNFTALFFPLLKDDIKELIGSKNFC